MLAVTPAHHLSPPAPPRVVAVDLDGTLLPLVLDGSQRLAPSTVAAVRALTQMRIMVILVTGRMYRSAAKFARDLGLSGPVAAYQGALIREVATGEVLHHDPVSLDLTRAVLAAVRSDGLAGSSPADHPYTVNLYIDDELYVAERNAEVRRYENLSGMKAHVVGPLEEFVDGSLGATLRPSAGLRATRAGGPSGRESTLGLSTKIGVTGEPEALDRLQDELRAAFRGRLGVLKTWPFFLEIASATATKARALQILGDRCGFTASEVLAFGDSYNDADMLAWAGTGVAMSGAPAEVVTCADDTCESVDDDGFARYLVRQPWFPVDDLQRLLT